MSQPKKRPPTQEECDRYMGAAVERIWQAYPHMRATEGGLRESLFIDDLVAAMVVWMAETEAGGPCPA